MPIFMLPQTAPRPTWLPSLGVLSEPLATGERGTAQTIDWMRRLIDESLRDEKIVRLAIDIVSGTPDFDDVPKANAIYDWVHRNIRFVKDPVNKEKLYRPADLLQTGAGDCDDISMLMATLLMAIGIPARFVTVSANASEPDQFSHVYVEAELPEGSGNWVPMDAARPDSSFASEPPMYYRKRAWSLIDSSYEDLSGTHRRGNVLTRTRTLGEYPRYRSLEGDLGAYVEVPHFAYPGWRMRIPGGPAGGHYKGFTHNYSAGTTDEALDQFEADRAAGRASHDTAHANPRAKRGVYRGPAEVPPAPNAGTFGYRVFRGYQTQRHPGTSEAPGSFPQPFVQEDLEPIKTLSAAVNVADFFGLGAWNIDPCWRFPGDPNWGTPCGTQPADVMPAPPTGEGIVAYRGSEVPPLTPDQAVIPSSASGATSVITQPPPSGPGPTSVISRFLPQYHPAAVSPQPAPRVSISDFIPDWQITTGPGGTGATIGTKPRPVIASWMDDETLITGYANKWVVGVAAVVALVFLRRR